MAEIKDEKKVKKTTTNNTNKKGTSGTTKKASTRKSATAKKATTTKKTTGAKTGTKTGTRRTNTTTKKTSSTTNKTNAKKSTSVKKTTPTKVIIDKPVLKEKEVEVKEVKKVEVKPEIKEVKKVETKTEAKKNENSISIPKIEIKKQNVEEISDAEKKINKRIDIGILTVIIGLFVLVLTTYLSSEIDLSIEKTRLLIIVALAIEAIGMIIMLVNIWKRK